MSPLANAILGVLFLGMGAGATLLMYFLRGAAVRPRPAASGPAAEPPGPVAAPRSENKYLAPWKRPSDGFERHLDDIHQIAETGRSIIEPMRTKNQSTSWDDLLIKGAQLAKFPLDDEQSVRTETILGPRADKPLVMETPIIVSHMSFGALSREVKTCLGQGKRRGGECDMFR